LFRFKEPAVSHTVYLFLKADGTDIQGSALKGSPGGEGAIECIRYEQAVTSVRDAAAGSGSTGRRVYAPLLIRKRIDRSSPLLLRALTQNQTVEGTFRFYRPSPTGNGTAEQFYTVTIRQGHVASVTQMLPDTTEAATMSASAIEEVTFIFRSIAWTCVDSGISNEDSLTPRG